MLIMAREDMSATASQRWAERLHAFQMLIANGTGSLEHRFSEFLAMAAEQFELDSGIILRRDGAQLTVLATYGISGGTVHKVGDVWPQAETFAQKILKSGASLASHHVSRDASLRDYPFFGITRPEVYLGSPILCERDIFGVISMMAATPRPRPFDVAEVALLELMGQALGYLVQRDQLERQRQTADRERDEANAMFRTAFDSAPIGMALLAIDGRWLRVNESLCRLVGYSEQELLARDFQSVTFPADLDTDMEQLHAVLAGTITHYRMEKRYIHKDGHCIWAELSVALVREQDGTPRCFVSQIQGIDSQKSLIDALERQREELKAANDKLTLLAAVDPLTEVLNRRALGERLEALTADASARGRPLGFLMVDVDHFKSYNDRFGHVDGDHALRIIAANIAAAAREGDLVGRFGGEEFLVLLPDTDADGARAVAERIRAGIARCAAMREPMTVSIGVHVLASGGGRESIDQAIERADVALYQAKNRGRNRVELA